MTSDTVSVGGGHNSLTPSEPFADGLERVVAEADIRNLSARFSDAVNYNDPDAFSTLWGANSIWEIGEPYVSRANGRAEIVALFRRLRQSWAFFVQLRLLGALLFAALSFAIRPRMVTVLIMFGGAIAYVLYAHNFQTVGLALTLAVFVGVFANGGIAAFYAISPFVYPTVHRGAGVGLMIGFGRGVAILAGGMDAAGHLSALRGRPRRRRSLHHPARQNLPRAQRRSGDTGDTEGTA
jgi:SnoaL-like domain